jgi:urea transport system permease protein
MLRILLTSLLLTWLGASAALAQTPASPGGFRELLQENFKLIQRSSVKTVGPLLSAIREGKFEQGAEFLSKWEEKDVWYRKQDNRLFYVKPNAAKAYDLVDIETGEVAATAKKGDLRQIKPNSGVRAMLSAALVEFRLASSDPNIRRESLESISRNAKPEHLKALREAIAVETDADLKTRFGMVERLLAMQFGENTEVRVSAIQSFKESLGLEVRASLNPLLSTSIQHADKLPSGINLARVIVPGQTVLLDDGTTRKQTLIDRLFDRNVEMTVDEAYERLAGKNGLKGVVSREQRDAALVDNLDQGRVAGFNLADLDNENARNRAYRALADAGKVPSSPDGEEIADAVSNHVFYATYDESDKSVTDAARDTLGRINMAVRWNTYLDLFLDAISLASIYFLAAIGLAITFGVMRVINMAHGEFIMMGAYTGYVVQQFITNYTLSILVAIPMAFAVTFAAGVALERLVIRYLYNRPLETLLATFGISIALQQLAKNIFGTQARPLTAPDWLDGALVINDVVSISWIRIAIFALGTIFFAGLWWTLNKTRLGLETRAVVQNPRMAASMGINPDRINMLTFGLGSGIAGIAGVAIGLYAKVTSELGSDYIVQSFMTVVIGGVGNIWGTLAGAGLIGILQKLIENFNPSNTLAAQTYMIIFIIIFIQFRPRGLIALKGRAAEA